MVSDVGHGGEVTRHDDQGRQTKGTFGRVCLRAGDHFKLNDVVS